MCETIMKAVSLTKRFRGADKTWFTAVDSASLTLQRGKTLGLLGQSGSGKSTLGQMMVGLLKPDSGELFFHGERLSYPIRGQARRKIQILFQHPEVSFNPQLTLRQSLVEPFKLMGNPFDDGTILSVIEPFGLHAEHLARYPGELSGGELQHQTAYLFITHSTALAEQFCDEIVKMEDGRLGTLEAPPQTPVGT